MRNGVIYGVIACLLGMVVVFGCFAPRAGEESVYSGQYASLMWLAQVAVKLASLNEAENLEGLNDLSDRYGVDVTTPVQEFFDSAHELIQALKDLQKAMRQHSTSRDLESGVDLDNKAESERMLQAIKDLRELESLFNVVDGDQAE